VFVVAFALGVWSLVVVPEARAAVLNIAITVLCAAIAWGLLTLREGWRIAALAVLSLGIAAFAVGIAVTMWSGPFTVQFVGNDGHAVSDAAVVSALVAGLALIGWMVWTLTRPGIRRAFDRGGRADAPPE
jgi:hypothetical protein